MTIFETWQKYFCILLILTPLIILLPAHGETKEFKHVISDDGRFLKLSTGVVVDTSLKLMWAQSDNGEKISMDKARHYVSSFHLAGYDDWRFPTIQELETLLTPGKSNETQPGDDCSGNYQIHPFFTLTCCCPWALQDNGTRPASYPFMKKISSGSMWHHNSNTIGNRIIPVRDLK